jgi:HD-like signal output (HDOD) protein
LLQTPNVNIDSVVDLIKNDPALSVDLIRISNSALYSRGRECVDLSAAIQRLGIREVLRVIALSLGKNIFGKGLTNYGVTADEYWSSSVMSAILMEELANRLDVDMPDGYITGILHGIGRVVINQLLEDIGWSWFEDTSKPLEFWEVDTVGFTHASAGAIVLKEWGFPDNICEAITHQLDSAMDVSPKTLQGQLRFAVQLIYTVKAVGWKPTDEKPEIQVLPEFCEWAGFADRADLSALVVTANDRLAKVRTALDS